MSEQRAWRPPLAPKPSPSVLQATASSERDTSSALRGATSAFNPAAEKSAAQVQTSSASALFAAAAAGKARSQQAQKDGVGARNSVSPVRGRSQLSIDLQRAKGKIPSTSNGTSQPPLNRSTPALAARIASANTSPVRSEASLSRGSSPRRRVQQARSRENSILSRTPTDSTTRSQGSDALSGATASVAASPNGQTRSPLSRDVGRLDFGRLPALSQAPAATGPPPRQLSSTSTSAARAASQASTARNIAAGKPGTGASTTWVGPHSLSPDEDSAASSSPSPSIHIIPPAPHSKDDGYFHKPVTTDEDAAKRGAAIPVSTSRQPKTSPRAQVAVQQTALKDSRSGMTASNLADAMVASSLAATKGQLTTKLQPPPVPRRRSRSLINPRHHNDAVALKPGPMPVRPMKHTLRKHSPGHSDDEDPKRGRKHWVRKHPNKHREGDRKRWRDKVTEAERKRYEGVWAANRGLLSEQEMQTMGSSSIRTVASKQDLVLNVVVRDIWERSRLPRDVLGEVWDLVAAEQSRALSREEFVVGLWLIDQRLKGRKLPVKVSPSVWSSVRHIQGVKISNKPL